MKKSFLDLKSWGPLKIFSIRSGFLLGPRPIHMCQKTELKSCWTVPLNIVNVLIICA
jgi:hypothetical protein